MAERLGLGPEVRELKLGPTFMNDKSTAFHTLKYDFKPASVDVSKMATVDVGASNTMTITVPHLDGADIPQTVFKGSQRPYHKECVLIIDRITGEVTLEKLSANIQVKKTRTENKSWRMPLNPKNNSAKSATSVEIKKSPTHGRSNGRTKVISGKKREPSVQLHPKQQSPLWTSPYHNRNSPNISMNNCSTTQSLNTQSTLASLPMIGSDNDDFGLLTVTNTTHSSASTRTSPQPIPTIKSTTLENEVRALSDSSSSSSDSENSDNSDTENTPASTAPDRLNGTIASPTLLPENLLKDDLQLSESESDND